VGIYIFACFIFLVYLDAHFVFYVNCGGVNIHMPNIDCEEGALTSAKQVEYRFTSVPNRHTAGT